MGEFYTRKKLRLPYDKERPKETYFLTICVQNREKILCEITEAKDEMTLPTVRMTKAGQIAEKYLRTIPGLDGYVIMPNHVHMIVVNEEGENISSKVRSFKVLASKEIGRSIWQRSFYDHGIRNEEDYLMCRKYMEENPIQWSLDKYYQK